MARTVRCPNCNAALAFDASQPTQRCDYCKTDVITSDLLSPARPSGSGGGASSGGKVLIALVVVAAVGVGVFFLLSSQGKTKRQAVTTARKQAHPIARPAVRPKGPRVGSLLGVRDVTGDGIADLVFGQFCTSDSGGLYRCGVGLLDGQQGKVRWSKTYLTTTGARGARSLCHGVVVAQDNTRSIVAYEAASGAQRWRLTLSDFARYGGRPAGSKERPVCLFSTEDRALSVVDVKTGKLLWRRDGLGPWGLRDLLAGIDSVLLEDSEVVDLFTGAARKTGLTSKRPSMGPYRAAFVLAGEHAYRRPARARRITVFRTRDWRKLGEVDPGAAGRLGLYPVGPLVLLLDPFQPPTRLGLLDGARLVGPLVVSQDELIAQARLAGDTILLLTVNKEGTRRTTLRAYDRALKAERWSAQLDASGRSFKFKTRGPNFGGGGGTSSSNGLLAASTTQLFIELPVEQGGARLSQRALADGKVLGEVSWPSAHIGGRGLRGIHTGARRVFVREADDTVVAIDPATRKVAWTRRWR